MTDQMPIEIGAKPPVRRRSPPGIGPRGRPRKSARGGEGSKVTKAVETLIEGMVFHGLTRPEAAELAGITDHGAYSALRKPHVIKAFNAMLEAKRLSERPRNLDVAVSIRDDAELGESPAGATARLKAISTIEGRPEGGQVNVQINNSVGQLPGYILAIDPRHLEPTSEEQDGGGNPTTTIEHRKDAT